jgi:prefoldin subunit 5
MPQPTNKKTSKHTRARTGSSPKGLKNRRDYIRGVSGIARLPALLVLLTWFIILAVAIANRQNIFDWWRLQGYHPPTEVAQIAGSDTMTAYARKIWYVNHPAFDDKPTFRSACPNNGGEQTIVLGCYHSDQAGIFVLSVTDPRLKGVMEVTSAHEMLHAAYDRLSSADKKSIDAQLLAYFNSGLTDARIKTTIAAYKQTEPNDLVNEMHSIFGTEVAKLPAGLEQYYKRYFTNRQQVVALGAQYQAEFTSRQQAVAQYDDQLTALKKQIDSQEADLKTKQAGISDQHDRLIQLRNGGDVGAYNAAVPTYNAAIDTYNQEVATVRSLINQYNQLVVKRNAIALEEDELVNVLNSNTPSLKQ